jgi:Asp-tRNA(Asn)/Glu-tRNA(Gln) amidotransferase A subunit family amidase
MDLGCHALQATGAQMRTCTLPPWAGAAFDAHAVVQGYEAWRCLGWELDHHAASLSPVLRDYLESTRGITAADYEAAQALVTQARLDAQAWLQGVGLLLTPSAPDEPPDGLGSTGTSTFNRLWTLLGVPCISVPGALGAHGAPMGLQLIAPLGADARLLAAAHRLERALAAPPKSPQP